MARPFVHPSILADKGVPITLVGPHHVTLVYGFQALMELEERFGSIQGAVEILDAVEKGKADAKIFTGLVQIMACGLIHETAPEGEMLGDPDNLAPLLETFRLREYADALGDAFTKAFPQAPKTADQDQDQDADPSSPGPSGTGAPGSTSASLNESSGA